MKTTPKSQLIKQIFDRVYGEQKNFMTPEIVRYGVVGFIVYEVSKGQDFDNRVFYGLTFIDTRTMEPWHQASAACESLQEVNRRVQQIRHQATKLVSGKLLAEAQ